MDVDTPFLDHTGRPLYLGGLYRGASVFLLLSGPSLAKLDLSKLGSRGCIVLAVNNAATVVRPHLWVHYDSVRKFHDAIWRDPGVLKFVAEKQFRKPLRERKADGTLGLIDEGLYTPATAPATVVYRRNANFRPDSWLEETTINCGNNRANNQVNKFPHCLSVMFAALRLCHALGFNRVFLLGCDFTMTVARPYSFEEYKPKDFNGGVTSNNNVYANMNAMLGVLAPKFTAAGFVVENCSPGSSLTAFPYRDFNDAVAATSYAARVDDTVGWYTL